MNEHQLAEFLGESGYQVMESKKGSLTDLSSNSGID